MSDDSHGLDQVGLNYHRVLDFIEKTGIATLYYLDLRAEGETQPAVDSRFPHTLIKSVSVDEMKSMSFWKGS